MKILCTTIGLIIAAAISWAITIGLVYLICLCFSWQFNLLVATGIWLVLILLKSIFGKGD